MKKQLLSCLLILCAFLSGCATKPIAVPAAFWAQPAAAIAIVTTELPKQGDFVMQGNQGLLDVAIAAAMTSEVRAATKKVDANTFLKVRQEFSDALHEAGFSPRILPEAVNLKQLPHANLEGDFDYDLTGLTKSASCRYVLLLELRNYGALRAYYAFIPTAAPSGFAAIRGRLIDTQNNKVLWDTGTAPLDGLVQEPVAGEWKQPPDYANLMAAADRALSRSRQFLLDRFFESRPSKNSPAAAKPAGQ